MARHIALLRGINVSGKRLVKMEDLREHFKMPGFKNVVTYIQSGNVVFDAADQDEATLRKKIEKRLLQKTGFEITTILRTIDEVKTAVEQNPFAPGGDDARKVYITFLEALPPAELARTLEGFSGDNEIARVVNREVYLATAGYADTRFSNTFVEKKLKLAGTTRNWATVNKLLEL